MLMIGDRKELILLIQKPGQRWYSLVCFGRKRHYRKDGSCKHTESVLAHVKPKMRKLVKVRGFGGKDGREAVTTEGNQMNKLQCERP